MNHARTDHEDRLDPRRAPRGMRLPGGPGTATAMRFEVLRRGLGDLLATLIVRLGR